MARETPQVVVPPAAAWLGGLGVIPFAVCPLVAIASDSAFRAVSLAALVGYAAIILSFLGGIHWGLAICQDAAASKPGFPRLFLSVLPALIAWPALLLPSEMGCVLLACAFVAMFFIDAHASRTGFAPAWYPMLRLPLSLAATASLIAGCYLGQFASL